jgi:hypothetical protein
MAFVSSQENSYHHPSNCFGLVIMQYHMYYSGAFTRVNGKGLILGKTSAKLQTI